MRDTKRNVNNVCVLRRWNSDRQRQPHDDTCWQQKIQRYTGRHTLRKRERKRERHREIERERKRRTDRRQFHCSLSTFE